MLGSPLQVQLPTLGSGDKTEVTIEYSTTEESTALGWLEKEYVSAFSPFAKLPPLRLTTSVRQTAGKQFEYLFSQCQPIYARTLAPLQGALQPFCLCRSPFDVSNRHAFRKAGLWARRCAFVG